MTTNNLTEQWKNGELEKGKKYWCKLTDGTSEICYLWLQTNHFTTLTGYQSNCLPDDYISEVLAPVPSYEQWEKLNWYAGNGVEENQELKMENAKLKELLKESEIFITRYKDLYGNLPAKNIVADRVLDKIDEVLK